VRVLFDQGTPVPLRKHLCTHQITTAYELGWGSLKNGELLQQAQEHGFDVMVTTDQNLKYQQNPANRKIAIVVLSTTSWPRIQKEIEKIAMAIGDVKQNSYHEVFARHRAFWAPCVTVLIRTFLEKLIKNNKRSVTQSCLISRYTLGNRFRNPDPVRGNFSLFGIAVALSQNSHSFTCEW